MRDTYSLYDAKAKLSAIIRRVREGHSVIVTVHGEPVAEIRPAESVSAGDGLERRMAQLAERGVLLRPEARHGPLKPITNAPGALARFLADRDE
jgi:prevent-host-death family protein